MDPLSLTASVTAVVTLAFEVTKTLSKYIRSVKHAPTESHELAKLLSALDSALKALDGFLADQSTKINTFTNTSMLYSTVTACDDQLKSLQPILEKLLKISERRALYRNVKWPFQKEEHDKTIATLRGYIQIFHFSLTVDNCDLLCQTSVRVSEILQAQQDISGREREIRTLAEEIGHAVQALGSSARDAQDKVTEIRKGQLDDERQTLLDWIGGTVDPSSNHNNAVKKRESKTGTWFLDSDDFYNWMSSGGFLWLHGIPGCGKTVLCSTIIEAVKEVCSSSTTDKLAYFYFDFQDARKQDVSNLLRSLIKQLCAGEAEIPEEIHKLHDRYKPTGHTPTLEELTSTLSAVIRCLKTEIYIIMDALDEYPLNSANMKKRELLVQIERMVKHESGNLHILATSRDELDIRSRLGVIASRDISIQSSKVDADIKLYVRTCLEEDPFENLGSNLKQEIETKLGEGAQGMFRWVFCQLDALRGCRNPKALKRALTELPETLDETYERILKNIPKNDVDDARSILQWIAFSARALTIEEVAEAAVLRPGDDPIDPDDRLFNPKEVLRICHGLVSVSREGIEICGIYEEYDVVRFAHFSVQEFLMSDRSGNFKIEDKSAYGYIGESCISYLLSMDRPALSEQCLNDNPLLRYSAEYWFTHIKKTETNGNLASNLADYTYKLFSQGSTRSFVNWLRVRDPARTRLDRQRVERSSSDFPSPLYYASLLGLLDAVQRLFETGVDVNEQVGKYGSAIQRASENGHYEIIQWLLKHGADLNASPGRYCPGALCAASRGGHHRVVQLLLDNGAEIDSQDELNEAGTALQSAAEEGHEKICRLLLDRGADVNTLCIGDHRDALQTALASGHTEIAQMLLAQWADVNVEPGRDGTALAIAAGSGNEEIVQQLLKRGADVNAKGSSEQGDALQQASGGGRGQIVKLLLEAGAEVNAPGCEWWCSALQAASSNGYYEIVECLLEAGADVNTQGGWAGSALQAAAKYGDYDTVQQLLERGADVDVHGHGTFDPGSALQAASTAGHEKIIELLLKHGADVNVEGGKGGVHLHGTPLQAASSEGHHQIVQLLLHSGADVNMPGRDYGTALQAASAKGQDQIVQLLLKRGADVNAQGNKELKKRSPPEEFNSFKKSGNALQAASASGRHSTVQLLLDAGANVNEQNEDFGTALQAASGGGHDKVVQLLLDSGAHIEARGPIRYKRNQDERWFPWREIFGSALQVAEAAGRDTVVQLLLKHGAIKTEDDSRDDDGDVE